MMTLQRRNILLQNLLEIRLSWRLIFT